MRVKKFPSVSAAATAADVPLRLGKYEIIQPLAAGGMARIYLAKTTGLGAFERHVVLKVILPERAHEKAAVDMFLDEARLSASLNHQNVAQVFEVGEEGGIHYLAMEFVHGQDLRGFLGKASAKGMRVPIELGLTIIAGAAAGLHHAHERRGPRGKSLNIVHRDVSPANVMLGYDGSIKVLDFGIAKANARSTNTEAGIIKGKFAYMSPEQCRGKDIDRRSDVFALGIVLYETTTQHRAFRAENDFDTMHRIVNGEVTLPRRLVNGYPPELEEIVMKALATDVKERYQSAAALLEDIELFASKARFQLSTTAVGRTMRELFGDVPEPWVNNSGASSAVIGVAASSSEGTISTTESKVDAVVINPGAAPTKKTQDKAIALATDRRAHPPDTSPDMAKGAPAQNIAVVGSARTLLDDGMFGGSTHSDDESIPPSAEVEHRPSWQLAKLDALPATPMTTAQLSESWEVAVVTDTPPPRELIPTIDSLAPSEPTAPAPANRSPARTTSVGHTSGVAPPPPPQRKTPPPMPALIATIPASTNPGAKLDTPETTASRHDELATTRPLPVHPSARAIPTASIDVPTRRRWVVPAVIAAVAFGMGGAVVAVKATSKSAATAIVVVPPTLPPALPPAQPVAPSNPVVSPSPVTPTKPTTTPAVAPVDAPMIVRVNLDSVPSGAEVLVAGKKLGVTPFHDDRPAGNDRIVYILRAHHFADATVVVVPRADFDQTVTLRAVGTKTPDNVPAAAAPPVAGPPSTVDPAPAPPPTAEPDKQ